MKDPLIEGSVCKSLWRVRISLLYDVKKIKGFANLKNSRYIDIHGAASIYIYGTKNT